MLKCHFLRSSVWCLAVPALFGCGAADPAAADPGGPSPGVLSPSGATTEPGTDTTAPLGNESGAALGPSSTSGEGVVPVAPPAASTQGSGSAGEPEPAASASAPAPMEPAPVEPAPEPVGPNPDAATRARCTGTDPIACHFGGAPGNYDVTVVLGGDVAANTLVLAETRRVMLGAVATAAGETRRFTFSVNVRQPEGEPIQAVPAGISGLDIYFRGVAGQAPALSSVGFARAGSAPVIYVAGDSTVADQTGLEFGGWGQQLPQYFDYPVVVANYSDSGESSGSFLNARPLFGTIEGQLKANDWVLIQFGHNDKTVTEDQFHDNLTALVTRVKSKAAFPVLLTPVARAQFNGTAVATQHVNSTRANLPVIVARVAAEQGVPVLDLTARTTQWLREIGPNGWQAFHANGTDVTHTNDAGAAVEAGFVVDLMQSANLSGLLSHLR